LLTTGNSKRAFFYALTPFHRLYHNAVAALESEAAAALARAASTADAAGTGGTVDSVDHALGTSLDAIIETDDESDTSEDRMHFPNPEGEEPRRTEKRPPSSSRSPKAGAGRAGYELSSSGRPLSATVGFDNIYGDEPMEEGEEEFYAYEDAPSGLNGKRLNKADRNDERHQSFYKHKAAQSSPAAPGTTASGGFLSPLVTMDTTYPAPAGQGRARNLSKASAGSHTPSSVQQSVRYGTPTSNVITLSSNELVKREIWTCYVLMLGSLTNIPSLCTIVHCCRFDNLYSAEDFDYEDAMLNLSEAEQSVLYLRPPPGGSRIPGVPLIAGARSRAPAQHSPMVTAGLNPMMNNGAKGSGTAFDFTSPPRTLSAGAADVWADAKDVGGANPMAKRQGGIAEGQEPAQPQPAAEDTEEWRLEQEAEGKADDADSDTEGGEGVGGEDTLTAATPSSIPDVALQFLMSLDFRRFDPATSKSICRIIGDALSFLDTLWLRYISEDQLRFMFEGYFEQKRNHRVTTALSTTAGSLDSALDSDSNSEIYATKELKLIGMTPEIFKKLQKTTTVNRLRRILGIQVSLVVIEGADDTFTNVLSADTGSDASVATSPPPAAVPSAATANANANTASSPLATSPRQQAMDQLADEDSVSAGWVSTGTPKHSQQPASAGRKAATGADSDSEDEGDGRAQIDLPERYAELKHRTKLVLTSYTNMVGSIPPEMISYNSTIVKEVVRLAATVEGAKSINLTMANQFGLIFLDFPGFARIGKELADRGVFNMTNRIIHRLLAHPQVERYLDVIYSILEQTPSVLLLKDRSDHFLPCDRVKALPDSKAFKYPMLAAFINAIPNINAERRAAHLASLAAGTASTTEQPAAQPGSAIDPFNAFATEGPDAGSSTPPLTLEEDRLTGDEVFMSIYGGEEELIVRALHFNLQTTAAEVKAKKYDLSKTDGATGESIFHKCILSYIDEPFIYNSAIETFRLALKVLRERHIAGEITQLAAEKMLFSAASMSGETPWSLAYAHNCKPMVEPMAEDWTHTGEASGAPAEALALAPATSRRGNKKAPAASARSASPVAGTATAAAGKGSANSAGRSIEAQSDEEKSDTDE
jgi:hypothetical protein